MKISKISKDYLSVANYINSGSVTTTTYDDVKRKKYIGDFVPGDKAGFQDHAFARLYDSHSELGIQALSQCQNARIDGLAYLTGYNCIPLMLEMKTTLSWSSLGTALAQFLTGGHLLKNAKKIDGISQHGLVLFSRFSSDWIRGDERPIFPWAMLYRHLAELEAVIKISALQITPNGFENPFAISCEGNLDLMSLFDH